MRFFPRRRSLASTLRALDRASRSRRSYRQISQRAPSDSWGYVYFIRDTGSGAVKIGKASDPGRRLRTFQTASATRLVLEAVLGPVDDAYAWEGELHRRFARSRIRGEWFSPTPDVLAYLAEAKRGQARRSKPRASGCGVLVFPLLVTGLFFGLVTLQAASQTSAGGPMFPVLFWLFSTLSVFFLAFLASAA